MAGIDLSAPNLFPKSVLAFIALFWLLAVALSALGINETLKARNIHSIGTILRRGFFMGVIPSIVTIVIHLVAAYLQRVVDQLAVSTQAQVTVAGAALFVGFMAYFLKLKKQFWYGAVEVIASIVFVMNATANIDPAHPNQLAVDSALLASVYVVVRGLTNMTEGSIGKVNNFEEFIDKALAKLKIPVAPSVSSSPRTHQ